MKKIVTLGLALAAAGGAFARLEFVISPEIYAAHIPRWFDRINGGKALGDAIFAWLISDIANR